MVKIAPLLTCLRHAQRYIRVAHRKDDLYLAESDDISYRYAIQVCRAANHPLVSAWPLSSIFWIGKPQQPDHLLTLWSQNVPIAHQPALPQSLQCP
jgi:hypothetical protein